MLLVQVLQGVMEGVFLFLIASGLTLIFGVSRIVNFARSSFLAYPVITHTHYM